MCSLGGQARYALLAIFKFPGFTPERHAADCEFSSHITFVEASRSACTAAFCLSQARVKMHMSMSLFLCKTPAMRIRPGPLDVRIPVCTGRVDSTCRCTDCRCLFAHAPSESRCFQDTQSEPSDSLFLRASCSHSWGTHSLSCWTLVTGLDHLNGRQFRLFVSKGFSMFSQTRGVPDSLCLSPTGTGRLQARPGPRLLWFLM